MHSLVRYLGVIFLLVTLCFAGSVSATGHVGVSPGAGGGADGTPGAGGGADGTPGVGGSADGTPVIAPSRSGEFGSPVTIANPLGEGATIQSFLLSLVEIALIFALPIITLFIIIAGLMFVLARGNETKVTEARKALLYAIIGGLLILGANVIFAVIKGTVDAITVF